MTRVASGVAYVAWYICQVAWHMWQELSSESTVKFSEVDGQVEFEVHFVIKIKRHTFDLQDKSKNSST